MPEVLTQKGFKKYDGLKVMVNSDVKIEVEVNNLKIKCTKNHRVLLSDNRFEYVKNLQKGNTLYGDYIVTNLKEFSSNEKVYDLINVEDTHSYYTNNIISHNCVLLDEFAHISDGVADEFFSSVYPTISSGSNSKLIIVSTPKGINKFHEIWQGALDGVNNYKPLRVYWQDFPGRDEKWKEETIKNTTLEQFNQEFECVIGDTMIIIRDIDTGEIINVTMEELYNML